MINAVLLGLPLFITTMGIFLCVIFAAGRTPTTRAFFWYFLLSVVGQYAWLSTTEFALAFFPGLSGLASREVRATVARSLQFIGTLYLLIALGRVNRGP